jgi:hypothetical protein
MQEEYQISEIHTYEGITIIIIIIKNVHGQEINSTLVRYF